MGRPITPHVRPNADGPKLSVRCKAGDAVSAKTDELTDLDAELLPLGITEVSGADDVDLVISDRDRECIHDANDTGIAEPGEFIDGPGAQPCVLLVGLIVLGIAYLAPVTP